MWKITVLVFLSSCVVFNSALQFPVKNNESDANLSQETCYYDTDCNEFNHICDNGVCVPRPDSSEEVGIPQTESVFKTLKDYLPKVLIGSTCEKNEECSSIVNAVCRESICQCKDNYVTSLTSDYCLLVATAAGDPCEIHKQCEGIKNAVCLDGKCVVPSSPLIPLGSLQNSTIGKAITNVLSKAKVDNCTEDSDCSANYICLNNVCLPTPISPKTIDSVSKSVQEAVSNVTTSIEKSVKSVLSAAKPEKCTEDSDCPSKNEICLNDICIDPTTQQVSVENVGKSLQGKGSSASTTRISGIVAAILFIKLFFV